MLALSPLLSRISFSTAWSVAQETSCMQGIRQKSSVTSQCLTDNGMRRLFLCDVGCEGQPLNRCRVPLLPIRLQNVCDDLSALSVQETCAKITSRFFLSTFLVIRVCCARQRTLKDRFTWRHLINEDPPPFHCLFVCLSQICHVIIVLKSLLMICNGIHASSVGVHVPHTLLLFSAQNLTNSGPDMQQPHNQEDNE